MKKVPFSIALIFLLFLAACSEGSRASIIDWVRDSGGPAAADGAKVAVTVIGEIAKTNVPMVETATDKGLDIAGTRLADEPVSLCPVAEFTVDTDLNGTVGISATQLDEAIAAAMPGSPLLGLGTAFVNAGQVHGVNAYFLAGHAALNSAWGTNAVATNKNNLFGYGVSAACPYDCAVPFGSREESIEFVTSVAKVDYLTPGGRFFTQPTLAGMEPIYAANNSQWAEGVAAHMNLLREKTPCP